MIKCILIENDSAEMMWLSTLVDSMNKELEVMGRFATVQDALLFLSTHRIDLMISDVELDDGTIFDLLGGLTTVDFGLILTTSHEEYAIKAVKSSALDYITKPVDAESLGMAIDKFKEQSFAQIKVKTLLQSYQENNKVRKIAVAVENCVHLLNTSEILYFKADINYCNIHIEKARPILVSKTLKEFDLLLSNHSDFLRIHQSYLVNTSKIKKVIKTKSPQVIMNNGDVLYVSRSKKHEFETAVLNN